MEKINLEEFYKKLEDDINKIIKTVVDYSSLDETFVRFEINKAYNYAREAHEGDFRKSGEPYIIHPVKSTEILLSLRPDIPTIQACLLHDVVEDTPRTLEEIEDEFGEIVMNLCEGMEKVSTIKYRGEERAITTLRKMFVSMAEDIRVIFIKIADRLHNMQTLKHHPKKEKRERIALETLNVYSPIAERLGIYELKNQLEEECFKVLKPKEYKKCQKELNKLKRVRATFIKNVKKEIDTALSEKIGNYNLDFRVKSIYSIYKKMQSKHLENLGDLYDIFGIRITTDTVTNCYLILGIIHKFWKPLPKRFKDYIALPKDNGYRSLHTTIIGLLKDYRKQPTEIQIRTYEMHKVADIGVAAHFEYKEKGSKIATDIDWVKELNELSQDLGNKDWMKSLKVDAFRDRIFVLTPNGDALNLPAGSTPVDFAYEIHSDLGNHISIARVNSKIVPLDQKLKNGDVVEIVTDKSRKPNPFWLGSVKTTKARSRIKSYLSSEDKEKNRERGKEILNNYLEKVGLEKLDKDLTYLKNIDGQIRNMDDRWSILEQVGNFSQPPNTVIKRIVKANKIILDRNNQKLQENQAENLDKTEKKIPENIEEDNTKNKVIIAGDNDIPYTLGKCCEPTIHNKIVGYVTSKGNVTIHDRECHFVKNTKSDRFIPARWEGLEDGILRVTVVIESENTVGMLKKICDILFDMDINIDDINTSRKKYSTQEFTLVLEFKDSDYLRIESFVERAKYKLGEKLYDIKIKKIEEC
ncbi:MAG: RelA/SpoT family protein [Candidatus Gracilibacteria bacterium]|nr:RelA/SpoT family protein [Candidatus Gracilibacteria bacterium]